MAIHSLEAVFICPLARTTIIVFSNAQKRCNLLILIHPDPAYQDSRYFQLLGLGTSWNAATRLSLCALAVKIKMRRSLPGSCSAKRKEKVNHISCMQNISSLFIRWYSRSKKGPLSLKPLSSAAGQSCSNGRLDTWISWMSMMQHRSILASLQAGSQTSLLV